MPGPLRTEGHEHSRHDPDYKEIKQRAEKRHRDAKSEVVGQSGNDRLPITQTQNAGEEEVTCPIHEVKAAQQPEEVAEITATAGEMGRAHGKRAEGEVDDSSCGIDEAVRAKVRQVVTGEVGGDVTAKPGSEPVADAFMQRG